jgi:hypothetical protein
VLVVLHQNETDGNVQLRIALLLDPYGLAPVIRYPIDVAIDSLGLVLAWVIPPIWKLTC